MRISKDHLFRDCYVKGVSHLYYGRDLKAGRGMESFVVSRTEGFSCALTGGCERGGAAGG